MRGVYASNVAWTLDLRGSLPAHAQLLEKGMASTYTWHETDVLVGGRAWWFCTHSSLRPREARGEEEGEISGRKRPP